MSPAGSVLVAAKRPKEEITAYYTVQLWSHSNIDVGGAGERLVKVRHLNRKCRGYDRTGPQCDRVMMESVLDQSG